MNEFREGNTVSSDNVEKSGGLWGRRGMLEEGEGVFGGGKRRGEWRELEVRSEGVVGFGF